LYGRYRPGWRRHSTVSAAICAMACTQMMTASSTLMTVVRARKLPTAVITPIASKEMRRKSCLGCSRPDTPKNRPSRAAWNGTRDPPSSPANTEAIAVIRMSTVTTSAAVRPQLWVTTSEATDADWATLGQGNAPITPMFMAR
jgi:hypothetical protein